MPRKKSLRPVHTSKAFILKDGNRFRSLIELSLILDKMDDDLFHYHVTKYRNDFATWIEHTLNAKKLAISIGKMKDKQEMTYEIMKFVVSNI